MDKSALPYRPCVGIALFNAQGHVFVGERIDTPGAWQMPQGGIDEGEDLEVAARRELCEEIGTDSAELLKISEQTTRYDLPAHLLGRLWDGRYRGQEQHWVAMRFTGEDSDIRLDADQRPEFKAWQWVALSDTLKLIVPFKQDTYQRVIAMFSELSLRA
ncbi:MAG TPA: RNA pyrophosphohydrolase [Alphaproteobacteria bacterium]|nr:MAG: RNA pyrophosphohydrolase [Rhodospirillales bacterium]HOO82611.1 RNA pyrophosphohydrolase [Alphaproteobacteria bacterium]